MKENNNSRKGCALAGILFLLKFILYGKEDCLSMNENFVIRPVKREESGKILDFIKYIAEYEKMLDQVVATEELLDEWIFQKGLVDVLFAEENGEVVGFALFFSNFSTFVGRAGLYLEDLFVKPEHRGKGYGKALLKKLAQIAVERKCRRMEWCCLDWNTPSINFYKSVGAIPMDEWTTYRLAGKNLDKFAAEE